MDFYVNLYLRENSDRGTSGYFKKFTNIGDNKKLSDYFNSMPVLTREFTKYRNTPDLAPGKSGAVAKHRELGGSSKWLTMTFEQLLNFWGVSAQEMAAYAKSKNDAPFMVLATVEQMDMHQPNGWAENREQVLAEINAEN